MKFFCLAVGSLGGGFARYFLAAACTKAFGQDFPLGILIVNVLGCLAIGFFGFLIESKAGWGPEAHLLLVTGFCGAFTTFSTLIHDTDRLWQAGEILRAAGNLAGSVILGLLAYRLGIFLARAL